MSAGADRLERGGAPAAARRPARPRGPPTGDGQAGDGDGGDQRAARMHRSARAIAAILPRASASEPVRRVDFGA